MNYRELKFQPEKSGSYLGSPSLVRLPDGAIVAVHDYFGDRSPRRSGLEMLTSVYRSEDDGDSWVNITHIVGAFWSSLFLHRGELYLLGVDCNYGSIVIRRSMDGGFSWSYPEDSSNGLLFAGGAKFSAPNYHGAPVPVAIHGGRIYRGFEDNVTNEWPKGFQAFVISAPIDSDLLDAANWTMSNKLPANAVDFPQGWGGDLGIGWLEGNIIEDPQGKLWNIVRLYSEPTPDKAAMLRISRNGRHISFDRKNVIDLPGGAHKFMIRRDGKNGKYICLGNACTSGYFHQRNELTMAVSDNLRDWRLVATLVRDESGLNAADSLRLTGFQYPDWQFDGDDIICLVRTAYRGAVRFHDSNRITFHRFKNYQRYMS